MTGRSDSEPLRRYRLATGRLYVTSQAYSKHPIYFWRIGRNPRKANAKRPTRISAQQMLSEQRELHWDMNPVRGPLPTAKKLSNKKSSPFIGRSLAQLSLCLGLEQQGKCSHVSGRCNDRTSSCSELGLGNFQDPKCLELANQRTYIQDFQHRRRVNQAIKRHYQ